MMLKLTEWRESISGQIQAGTPLFLAAPQIVAISPYMSQGQTGSRVTTSDHQQHYVRESVAVIVALVEHALAAHD